MKVVILGLASPYRGGISDSNESLANALQNRGYEVFFINFKMLYPKILFPGKSQFRNESGGSDIQNFDNQRILSSINPTTWIKAVKSINNISPDFIVVRHWTTFLSPVFGTVLRLIDQSIPKILVCDNVTPHEPTLLDKTLSSYLFNTIDIAMMFSRNTLLEFRKVCDKPAYFFPHPINYNLGEKQSKQLSCESLGINPEDKYFLYFGLIRKYKGLDLTLESYARYLKKGGKAKLIVAGEFYDNKSVYDSIVRKHSIEDFVIFHDFYIPDDNVKFYFSASDILLQTYWSASQSGVSQIAYHFDLPMLVTNVGGLPEMIEGDKAGYIVDTDPNKICDILFEYSDQKRKEFQFFIQSQKHKYSWEEFVKKIELSYKK